MLIRILHKLGIIDGILLEDFQYRTYISIKRKNKFGKWAYVYPFTKVGHVKLNEDGTCFGESFYIDKWIDM